MKADLLVTASFISVAMSQSLLEATAVYPQLSSFRNLLQKHPSLIPPANDLQLTILVPSNGAFNNYLQSTGNYVASLPLDTLSNMLQYHTLTTVLSSAEFSRNKQVLANSQLTNETYDHRGGRNGQVVLISAVTSNTTNTSTITVSQSTPQAVDTVLSGGGATVNLDAINGTWSGGLFQIVDGFLTLPDECIDTMTSNPNNLTTLVSALGRTNLSDTLNNFVNVTCLAPTNTAFNSAGSPDTSLSVPDLTKALKYHTISGAQYSLNLQDGEVLTSVGGPEIKVRVDANGTIWFNDAMVVQPNVITNNGVIHVLDRVMSMPNSTTSTSKSTSSITSSLAPSHTSSRAATVTTAPSTTASASSSPTKSATSGSTRLLDSMFSIVASTSAAAVVGILFMFF